MRALTVVDFPTPGDPVIPTTLVLLLIGKTFNVESFSANEIARASSLGFVRETEFNRACHS
jgi:hypothetical protein